MGALWNQILVLHPTWPTHTFPHCWHISKTRSNLLLPASNTVRILYDKPSHLNLLSKSVIFPNQSHLPPSALLLPKLLSLGYHSFLGISYPFLSSTCQSFLLWSLSSSALSSRKLPITAFPVIYHSVSTELIPSSVVYPHHFTCITSKSLITCCHTVITWEPAVSLDLMMEGLKFAFSMGSRTMPYTWSTLIYICC